MSSKRVEYLKERLELSSNDLYETIVDINRIILSKVIDYLTFIFTLGYAIYYVKVQYNVPGFYYILLIIVWVIGMFILKTLLRGRMLGALILNIKYVNVQSKKQVTLIEYIKYLKKAFRLKVKYYQIFSYYLKYDGRLNQNQPMKKFGMIFVDGKKYKRFVKEHNYLKRELQYLNQ